MFTRYLASKEHTLSIVRIWPDKLDGLERPSEEE